MGNGSPVSSTCPTFRQLDRRDLVKLSQLNVCLARTSLIAADAQPRSRCPDGPSGFEGATEKSAVIGEMTDEQVRVRRKRIAPRLHPAHGLPTVASDGKGPRFAGLFE